MGLCAPGSSETRAKASRFLALRVGRRMGGTWYHTLQRKASKSHSHLHFAKGEVLFQQPQSVRTAVGHFCGQATLIQRNADLSVHHKALIRHPLHCVLQARTNHLLSSPWGERPPSSLALPLACALSAPPPIVTGLLLPCHQTSGRFKSRLPCQGY